MVWPTLGSRTAKDQIRSDQVRRGHGHVTRFGPPSALKNSCDLGKAFSLTPDDRAYFCKAASRTEVSATIRII